MAKIPFIGLLELHFLLVLLNEVHIRVPHQMLSVDDFSYKSEGNLMGFNWSKLSVVEYIGKVPTYLTPVSVHSRFPMILCFYISSNWSINSEQRKECEESLPFSLFINSQYLYTFQKQEFCWMENYYMISFSIFGVEWKYQWRKFVSSA